MKFKEGDLAFSFLNGWGRIEIVDDNSFPARLNYNLYTEQGYYLVSRRIQTLFTEEEFEKFFTEEFKKMYPKPEPEFENGEKVWCRFSRQGWNVRFYIGINEEGRHTCYPNQLKEGDPIPWDEVRKWEDIPEELK